MRSIIAFSSMQDSERESRRAASAGCLFYYSAARQSRVRLWFRDVQVAELRESGGHPAQSWQLCTCCKKKRGGSARGSGPGARRARGPLLSWGPIFLAREAAGRIIRARPRGGGGGVSDNYDDRHLAARIARSIGPRISFLRPDAQLSPKADGLLLDRLGLSIAVPSIDPTTVNHGRPSGLCLLPRLSTATCRTWCR